MTRETSPATHLIRLGFTSGRRADRLLADAAIAGHVSAAAAAGAPLDEALGRTADPDGALLLLVRLAESAASSGGETARLLADVLRAETPHRRRLLAVLGASTALGDLLVAHPEGVRLLAERSGDTPVLDLLPEDERAKALQAVGADPADALPVAGVTGDEGVDTVRRTYRRRLLEITAADLTAEGPLEVFDKVAAALADIAGAALDAALAVARAEAGEPAARVRLAVLGMGKTGGRELNYISDVDVLYVAAPATARRDDEAQGTPGAEPLGEEAMLATAAGLARRLATIVSATSAEPALWPLDVGLRPEGKDGPLVRTLDSYRAYYGRWAQSWEFQALLKARPVAGDHTLGEEFVALVDPLVWEAAGQENFVTDAQAMRRRVEALVPSKEADRQLKLGKGGLRDVEFTVQLLQLVHGRTDEAVRVRGTLDGIAALSAAGYIAREHAQDFARHYRFLRALEHRMQLHRLRRTHVVPDTETDLRRLGRALRQPGTDTAEGLEKAWRSVRREVRRLHEEIYYRPLLPLTARLSKDEVSLSPEAARARLAVIGYRAPERAVQQIAALTEGVSRRAAIQRQLLPVMLGWFGEGPDPDGGLLGFRRLSDRLGATHWYLKLLRDSGTAGRSLTHVLSHSAYVADALPDLPDAVMWLDDDAELAPRSDESLVGELGALLSRRSDPVAAAEAVRYIRRRELLRAALGDALYGVDAARSATMITPAGDLALEGALRVAQAEALAQLGREGEPLARFLIVAMGRTGGQEAGYASDADVLFVHEPRDGADEEEVARHALAVATRVRSLLADPGTEPPFPVDADLRPEGRNGPLTRSLRSYAEYYERWSEPWERQALLRARPAAGDPELAARFTSLIDPVRYPARGLPAGDLREMRRIKARVETERMPRGVQPNRHLKLGRGSLSDVEWTAQLLQSQHAGEHPSLRTTSTIETLKSAAGVGVLDADDAQVLVLAWEMASRIRAAIVLATGRTSGSKLDVLPHAPAELETVARLLGYEPGARLDLEEDYLRATRRARAVMERVFYG